MTSYLDPTAFRALEVLLLGLMVTYILYRLAEAMIRSVRNVQKSARKEYDHKTRLVRIDEYEDGSPVEVDWWVCEECGARHVDRDSLEQIPCEKTERGNDYHE